MKRTFAILMALMMLFSVSAYAESTEATDAATAPEASALPQITFDETAAPYQGSWVTFNDAGFEVYLPSDWVQKEVTDEMQAAGTLYAGTSADGAYAMTLSYAESGNVTTNDDLAAQLAAAGYQNVTALNINGIDVVGYDIDAQDVSGMAFLDSNGGMYVFSFTPASNETFKTIGQTIISSLSPVAEATDGTEETAETDDTAAAE